LIRVKCPNCGKMAEAEKPKVRPAVHRLMCGDSTDAGDVGRLMGGEKAGAILTDPPYGLNVTKKASIAPNLDYGNQDWDVSAPTGEQLLAILAAGKEAIIWGGNCMQLPVSPCWLVWDKKTDGLGFSEFELAWTTLRAVPRIFRQRPQNMDGGKVHPTQKPLALMVWCLDFVPDAASIFDSFLGSGTTLVACEQTGRIGYGMEICEKYCAVTLERLTGMGLEARLTE